MSEGGLMVTTKKEKIIVDESFLKLAVKLKTLITTSTRPQQARIKWQLPQSPELILVILYSYLLTIAYDSENQE